jgi:TonB family protein
LPRHGIARGISQFRDCAQFSQAEKSSEPLAFAKIALLSLLAHFCLVLAAVLLDPMPLAMDGSRAIPVEMVIADPQAPAKLSAARKDAPGEEPSAKKGSEAVLKEEGAHHAGSQGASASVRPAGSTAGLTFDAPPYLFRAFPVPVTAANGEAINYQLIVGRMLDRAKQYPESAVRRGAKGTATIGFAADEAGAITSVSLLRSSGETDLDSESVALVRRAAPFPPPPPGVKRSFAIEVAFEIKK